MKPKTIVIIIIVVLGTICAMQNTHPVAINLLFWHPELPLIIMMLILLAAGFIAGYLVGGIAQVRKKDKGY